MNTCIIVGNDIIKANLTEIVFRYETVHDRKYVWVWQLTSGNGPSGSIKANIFLTS
jgi:hypothetical protein